VRRNGNLTAHFSGKLATLVQTITKPDSCLDEKKKKADHWKRHGSVAEKELSPLTKAHKIKRSCINYLRRYLRWLH